MATINLDELREAVELARELERIADKVTPMLQLIKELGGGKGVIIPPATDRFLGRGEVIKILKCGAGTVAKLIERGQLTPYYVADSRAAKFRLSQVEEILGNRSKG